MTTYLAIGVVVMPWDMVMGMLGYWKKGCVLRTLIPNKRRSM